MESDIIAKFFTQRVVNMGSNDYKKIILLLKKSNKITDAEYEYLTFFEKEPLIINCNRLIDIINKINDKNFNEVCSKYFKNIIKVDNQNKFIVNYMGIDEFPFTKDQLCGIKNIMDFITDENQRAFGLYGYAGTGKTSVMCEVVYYFLVNKLIKSVAFSSPTNKSINVIKSKFIDHLKKLVMLNKDSNINVSNMTLDELGLYLKEKDITTHFTTIHRLLGYKQSFNGAGEKVFIKGTGKTKFKAYDLIIIDECSMVPKNMILHLFEEQMKIISNKKNTKLIFLGDPAQLLPVGEHTSLLFDNIKVNNPEISRMKSFTMTDVVRNNRKNVIDLCYELRKWVLGEIKMPRLSKFIGNGVSLYKYDDKDKKTDTLWFKRFMKNLDDDKSSDIMLSWTNNQSDTYNLQTRQKKFNKVNLNKYEIGDILIFTDYYNFNTDKDSTNNKFYTSDQIKITDINHTTQKLDMFIDNLPNSAQKMKNYTNIYAKYKNLLSVLNNKLQCSIELWHAYVQKNFIDINQKDVIPEPCEIYIVHDNSSKQLEEIKNACNFLIKRFKDNLDKEYKEQVKQIDNYVINYLWSCYNKILVDKFANVNYGFSITTHVSQASTYNNVFVDMDDMMNNRNLEEAKRCIYTATTRSSGEVHILF